MPEIPNCLDLDYYLIGFWVADGSCAKGRLRFLINQKDRVILDLFFSRYGGTRSEYSYNNGISYYSVPVTVVSDTMISANITPDKQTSKTGNISFPDKQEFCSFLLGYIDGDGSVSAPSFHRSARISMISQAQHLLECLSTGTQTYAGATGRLLVSKGRYYRLVYSRAAVRNLANALFPYLVAAFRKHRLIADIAQNYDYDRAKTFHSKLDETAYAEMVTLRQQGLSYSEIARRYGVAKQSVMSVVKKRMTRGAVAKG